MKITVKEFTTLVEENVNLRKTVQSFMEDANDTVNLVNHKNNEIDSLQDLVQQQKGVIANLRHDLEQSSIKVSDRYSPEDTIQALENVLALVMHYFVNTEVAYNIRASIVEGQRINAIKTFREFAHNRGIRLGLRETKEVVDLMQAYKDKPLCEITADSNSDG